MPGTVERVEEIATATGERIERYRLQAAALAVEILTAGAAVARIDVPDRSGQVANVVLGYADPADYVGARREYFGALVGRVANRIAGGRFELDGRAYRLATNDGPHHLHGGRRGFDRHLWRASMAPERAALQLKLVSPDGDEGYPGELSVRATYSVAEEGVLRLECVATTTAPTLVNLTNHGYFNLAGSGDVLGHELAIDADAYCVVDSTLIPTGDTRSVNGTPFDFRQPTPIGRGLESSDPQLAIAGGYDHCFVLRDGAAAARGLRHACTLVDPRSGRRLRIETDQPAVQFYSGNFLDGTACGPGGVRYGRHAGLCLETQHFPDAPHHRAFPSIELRPGRRYATVTTWRFDVLP
jgi:aldose 1-epimerase